MQVVVQPGLYIAQLSTLQLYPRVATHIPQLWDFRMRLRSGVAHQLICQVVPSGIHRDLGIHQVLGHHRSLCQFKKVEDHTLALSDEVEVSTEGIRELLQWMGGSGHRCIFQTLLCDNLLTSFHSHFDEWHQSLVLCQAHLSLPDHKPFAACPGPFLVRELRPVKHAQHASYWHFILTKGQLLQEVIGLEHDITNTGSSQPAGFIHLLLWSLLQVLRVNRIQGEQGLPGCSLADLQGQEQILQVHSSCWLQGGCDLHGARCFIQHQAAHATAGGLTAQACCQ
mmetsp:Transcript_7104/g.16126  ORF Transcript_7104/g.16126 Transcript_7104/m.16126 type:complete len:282 (-) Transcript_7104:886-1731(-)